MKRNEKKGKGEEKREGEKKDNSHIPTAYTSSPIRNLTPKKTPFDAEEG